MGEVEVVVRGVISSGLRARIGIRLSGRGGWCGGGIDGWVASEHGSHGNHFADVFGVVQFQDLAFLSIIALSFDPREVLLH